MKIDYSSRVNPMPMDAYKAMFGQSPQSEDIKMFSVERLQEYDGQPFKPYPEQKLRELAEDIAANGVLSPLIVRGQGEGWQILAGHNRRRAAMLAGLSEVPCIVKDVDDDMAALIVVNTNLNQREELLPSEKAFAYKMQLEAMKRQAGRPSIENVSQFETQKRSDQILAEQTGESRAQIQRYIRLTWLVPELREMVDAKSIPFMAGVNLSYHHPDLQRELLEFLEANEITKVSLKQSEEIKALTEMHTDSLMEIFGLSRSKTRPVKKAGKKTMKAIEAFFAEKDVSDDEIAELIISALTEREDADGEKYSQ